MRVDVTGLIRDFAFNQPITGEHRLKQVSSVNGKVEIVADPLPNMSGIIQPMKIEEFDQNMDLDRSKEHIALWVQQQLLVGETVIFWKGNEYLVRKVRDFSDWGAGYYRCLAERVGLHK